MRILINLVSGQNIPNYRAIKEVKPDKIVYFYTKRSKPQMDILMNESKTESDSLFIGPYDFEEIEKKCLDLVKESPQDEWILNMTGGTKLTSLAAYRAFYNLGLPVFYIDSENRQIIYLTEGHIKRKPFRVNFCINEILRINGQSAALDVKNDVLPEKRKNITEELFKLNQQQGFKKFIKKVPERIKEGKISKFDEKYKNGRIKKSEGTFLMEYNDSKITFTKNNIPGNDADIYATTGRWFEEYIYLMLKGSGYFNEIALNVTIPWKTADIKMPKNEMDILLLHNDMLYIIECKSGIVKADDINKLKNYKELFGGSFTVPLLVSFFPLKPDKVEKLQENKIEFFPGGWKNISQLPNFIRNRKVYAL